ncbi:DUF551 domain-containing protein [Citrobacter freundii]|nr:DUF551 domain-containing protein [Citrobacter freundii]
MNTITRFTKEQLIKRLEEQESSARYALGFVQDSQILRDIEMDLRINEIALASLEAEPMGYMNRFTGRVFTLEEQPGADTDAQVYVPVYTAPPAPVVPDNRAITQHFDTIALETAKGIMCDVNRRHEFLGGEVQLLSRIQCRIDTACRAAMLQGSQPVSNRDELPDGWIKCSKRMPDKDGNYWGWWSKSKSQGPVWFTKTDSYSYFQSSEITHWMPLPAAPQQENT